MDQHPDDTNVAVPGDVKAIEGVLKALWERTKRAVELIAQLREERLALHSRTRELENEVVELRRMLQQKEEDIRTLRAEQSETRQGAVFSNGEKEQLSLKVKELLAKIEAYL